MYLGVILDLFKYVLRACHCSRVWIGIGDQQVLRPPLGRFDQVDRPKAPCSRLFCKAHSSAIPGVAAGRNRSDVCIYLDIGRPSPSHISQAGFDQVRIQLCLSAFFCRCRSSQRSRPFLWSRFLWHQAIPLIGRNRDSPRISNPHQRSASNHLLHTKWPRYSFDLLADCLRQQHRTNGAHHRNTYCVSCYFVQLNVLGLPSKNRSWQSDNSTTKNS